MSVLINRTAIKKARDAHVWTQEDLAAASGLSPRTVQRIEAQGRCSKDSLKALSAAFNRPIIDFIAEDKTHDKPIDRTWIIGPIIGGGIGFVMCAATAFSLIQDAYETQATLSITSPAIMFTGFMTMFSVGFPAFMIHKYWNTSCGDYKMLYKG